MSAFIEFLTSPDDDRLRGHRRHRVHGPAAHGGGDGLRRAQGRRVHAAALRPVPRRTEGPAPAGRRHPQAVLQGRTAAEGGGRVPVLAGADHLGGRGVSGVRAGSVRRADDVLRPARRADRAAGVRRQRRGAGDLRRRLDGRLRHRARRLGEQLEVLAARRPAQLGADDQLRAGLRHGAGHGRDVRRTRCRCARSSTRSRATGSRAVSGSSRTGTSFRSSIGFFVFACAGMAETNRAPFDFPEAEQELVAGYHTEYSSMRFAMFFMAEYINMVTVSAVATNLYLGGWHGPFIPREVRLDLVRDQARRSCCSSICGCAGRCRDSATTS